MKLIELYRTTNLNNDIKEEIKVLSKTIANISKDSETYTKKYI